jgi:outer membrane protein OmpA-like peptidoglycan-associated protein
MRNFVIALSIFFMILFGWFFYQYPGDCCGEGKAGTEAGIISDAKEDGTGSMTDDGNAGASDSRMSDYLMFNWSDGEPVLRDDWDTRKNQIIKGLKEGEFLEITGDYRPDETNNSSYENLGIARANNIKNLISPPISEDRITIKSRQLGDEGDRNSLFPAVRFRNYVKKANLDTSIPDRTIIRFPFNSDARIIDPEIESYLNKVAARVQTSGEKIRLTGHTDNIGSIESNEVLGQRRAVIIQQYLIKKGVPSAKIITNSKGEASPIATNNSSAGRAKNRRTELEIIK